MLPPGATPCAPSSAQESFGVVAEDDGSYRITRGGHATSYGLDLDFALMLLDNELASYVGLHAPNRIFVHAGVAGHAGRAIIVPGRSMAGKTTLVLELARAGAEYYSDEFAVIDERGLVHPYARRPSPRERAEGQHDDDLERLGKPQRDEPLPIGAVVLTTYRAGTEWKPRRLSPARGVLAMLANTLPAMERSEEAVRVIRRALDGAVVLEGDRGEARAIAPQVLDLNAAASLGARPAT